MSLKEQVQQDLKKALIAKNEEHVSVLRMLVAAFQSKEIALGKKETGLSDEEMVQVVHHEMKKRQDAVTEFTRGGRPELAAAEKKELSVLTAYVPPELNDEEVEKIVRESVSAVGASGPQDFGKVMKRAMELLKGKVSGDRVTKFVKSTLSETQ